MYFLLSFLCEKLLETISLIHPVAGKAVIIVQDGLVFRSSLRFKVAGLNGVDDDKNSLGYPVYNEVDIGLGDPAPEPFPLRTGILRLKVDDFIEIGRGRQQSLLQPGEQLWQIFYQRF